MRRIISVIVGTLLVFVTTPVHGVDFPQGSFVLAGGKYRVMDTADPFEKIDQTFFSSIIIPVKDGQINFSTIQPFDMESGSQHFVGKINFELNGTYDKDTGVISTNFSQSNENSYTRKTGNGTREGSGGSVFTGSAKGTIIDNQVVLSFEGKLSTNYTAEANDKHIDSGSNSGIAWTKKVAFGTSEWVPQEESPEVEATTARDSGARASDLSGQVEIACPPDLEAWDVMKMGRVIYVDCHIKTGEDSKAVISFSDMTTFTIKPESEIVIDTPPEKDSKLKLLAGNIWVNVKKMVKDGTMEVHMGQAVAGIKGTTFELEETSDTSTVRVIEGVVAFKSKVTNDEKMVNPGEMLSATSTGLGEIKPYDANTKTTNTQNRNYYYQAAGALAVIGIGMFFVLKKYVRSRM